MFDFIFCDGELTFAGLVTLICLASGLLTFIVSFIFAFLTRDY